MWYTGFGLVGEVSHRSDVMNIYEQESSPRECYEHRSIVDLLKLRLESFEMFEKNRR